MNWKTSLLMASIVALATYIGYLVGQPEYCCAYSGNKTFIDYLAAWSGPITGIIAIITVFLSNWLTIDRERKTRHKHLQEFQSNATKALVAELVPIITQVEAIYRQCEDVAAGLRKKTLSNPIFALPPRAVFEGLQPRFTELPQHVVTTIGLWDHICQEHYYMLKAETQREPPDVERILFASKLTALKYAKYVAYLIEIGDEAPESLSDLQAFIIKVTAITNRD